jgi:3-oxoacyl-[acyl-carrier-protein] synthase-3
VDRTLKLAGWTIDQCDDFVFHQANGFMLQHLSEKIGLPATKVPKSIELFGNTSSASIPLTMVTERRNELLNQSRKSVLAGFGVGWSWAGAAIELGPIVVPEVIEMESLDSI